MEISKLLELAEEFGLPCVEREGEITIIGEKQFLVFNKSEVTQCLHLKEIY
jgi:hypothetical protein